MKTNWVTVVALLAAVALVLPACDFEYNGSGNDGCANDEECVKGVCEVDTGTCVQCLADPDCPSGKFCHTGMDMCVTCVVDEHCDFGVCDAENHICVECMADGDCDSGHCDADKGICIECGSAEDCVDDNPCSKTACVAGECTSMEAEDGIACDDGDKCTTSDHCKGGACTGLADPDCEEPGDPCEDAADGTPCDDKDPCTLDDHCFKGKCVADSLTPECFEDDFDKDGFTTEQGDCNDLDPTINPEAPELCNGQDDDCDGEVDEGVCQVECLVSGCSAEICAPEPMDSDCMWLPEYECLKFSVCGAFGPDGMCGWLETPEYKKCLDDLICQPKPEICDGKDNDCDGEVDEDDVCGSECVISGCSGQICAPEPMASDCGWLPEYECLKLSVCGLYGPNGGCGWLETPEYKKCMDALICQPKVEICDGKDNDCDGEVDEGVCDLDCGGIMGQACPDGHFCLVPDGSCGFADLMGKCVEMPKGCEKIYQPVCGCDGQTYGNECEMHSAGMNKLHDGECGQGGECKGTCDCYDKYGEKFDQACALLCDTCGMFWQCENEQCVEVCDSIPEDVWECIGPQECAFDKECDDNDECTIDKCINGVCQNKKDPDCGDIQCGGFIGLPCPSGMYCQFAPNTCNWADDMGICVEIPELCPLLYAPVCGCDKVTYPNECAMEVAKQSKLHDGECKQDNPCVAAGAICIGLPDEPMPDPAKSCPSGFAEVDLGGCQNWEVCCMKVVEPECKETCDCYDLYGTKFPEPCMLMCPNCDNYWQCENGQCVDHCGPMPDDVLECIMPVECTSSKDCDDNDVCTEDYCENGVCLHKADPNCISNCWLNEQCPDGHYCRFPDGQCDNAKSGLCEEITDVCLGLWKPVCGCDGKTYSNECAMQSAKQSMAHEGECKEECIPEGELYFGGDPLACCEGLKAIADCEEEAVDCDPDGTDCAGFQCYCKKCMCFVCAKCGNGECGPGENKCNCPEDCLEPGDCFTNEDCDDGNDCTLDMCKNGKCHHEQDPACVDPIGCWNDDMCGEGHYCWYPDGQCDIIETGKCQPIPLGCPDVWEPVCGCDGKTYGNYCEMQTASQSLQYKGECKDKPIVCGGFVGIPCPVGMYCKMPDGTCNGADMQGICTTVPQGCFALWDPVCGCDGKTYGNECELEVAMGAKDYDGECKNEQCTPLSPYSFGMCDMIVGVVYTGKECVTASGCSCEPFCDFVFDSLEECKKACQP